MTQWDIFMQKQKQKQKKRKVKPVYTAHCMQRRREIERDETVRTFEMIELWRIKALKESQFLQGPSTMVILAERRWGDTGSVNEFGSSETKNVYVRIVIKGPNSS